MDSSSTTNAPSSNVTCSNEIAPPTAPTPAVVAAEPATTAAAPTPSDTVAVAVAAPAASTAAADATPPIDESSCPYPTNEAAVVIPKSFTYYTDRYYNQYVIRDCKGVAGNNIRLLLHSNMLCMVCLDVTHDLVVNRHTMKIKYLGHSANKKQERQPIKVQGKKKKNATQCQKDMTLCFVETECGKEYKIPAGLDGSLLEINSNLVKYPSLIQRFPTTEGFIAIVNPYAKVRFEDFEKVWSATSGEMGGEGDE